MPLLDLSNDVLLVIFQQLPVRDAARMTTALPLARHRPELVDMVIRSHRETLERAGVRSLNQVVCLRDIAWRSCALSAVPAWFIHLLHEVAQDFFGHTPTFTWECVKRIWQTDGAHFFPGLLQFVHEGDAQGSGKLRSLKGIIESLITDMATFHESRLREDVLILGHDCGTIDFCGRTGVRECTICDWEHAMDLRSSKSHALAVVDEFIVADSVDSEMDVDSDSDDSEDEDWVPSDASSVVTEEYMDTQLDDETSVDTQGEGNTLIHNDLIRKHILDEIESTHSLDVAECSHLMCSCSGSACGPVFTGKNMKGPVARAVFATAGLQVRRCFLQYRGQDRIAAWEHNTTVFSGVTEVFSQGWWPTSELLLEELLASKRVMPISLCARSRHIRRIIEEWGFCIDEDGRVAESESES